MLDFSYVSTAQQFPYVQEVRYDQSFNPALSWFQPLSKQAELTALASAETRIEELSRMEENWDGYDALPINSFTKFNALSCLRGLLIHSPPPEITPNSNGTLSLEWDTERGVAHLEIGEKRISFYIKPTIGQPIFLDASTSDVLVESDKIGRLVSANLFPLRFLTSSVSNVELGGHVSVTY